MSNILKFQLQSQFQRSLYQTCVCSNILQIKDIKTNLTEFLFWCLGHVPEIKLGGAGGQKLKSGDLGWRPIDRAF